MKPGPKEDRVKINCSFDEAIEIALSKKKPIGGWPKPPKHIKHEGNELDQLINRTWRNS